jgi:hypothetical protein
MTTKRFVLGVLSAIALDVGVAILAAHVMMRLTGRHYGPVALLVYYLFAAGVTLLPDFLDLGMKGRHVGGEHHSIPTHWPSAAILGAALVWLALPFWGLLIAVILLLHYVHDSAQRGTGIEWLAPWSRQRYTFFDRPKLGADRPLKLVYAIPDKEMPLRNMPTTRWLEVYYLRWTGESVAGLVAIVIALVIVIRM